MALLNYTTSYNKVKEALGSKEYNATDLTSAQEAMLFFVADPTKPQILTHKFDFLKEYTRNSKGTVPRLPDGTSSTANGVLTYDGWSEFVSTFINGDQNSLSGKVADAWTIKNYLDTNFRAADALTFKGTISPNNNQTLPTENVKIGDVYVVSSNGSLSINSQNTPVNTGDMIICIQDSDSIKWNVVEANIKETTSIKGSTNSSNLVVFSSGNGGQESIYANTYAPTNQNVNSSNLAFSYYNGQQMGWHTLADLRNNDNIIFKAGQNGFVRAAMDLSENEQKEYFLAADGSWRKATSTVTSDGSYIYRLGGKISDLSVEISLEDNDGESNQWNLVNSITIDVFSSGITTASLVPVVPSSIPTTGNISSLFTNLGWYDFNSIKNQFDTNRAFTIGNTTISSNDFKAIKFTNNISSTHPGTVKITVTEDNDYYNVNFSSSYREIYFGETSIGDRALKFMPSDSCVVEITNDSDSDIATISYDLRWYNLDRGDFEQF